MCEAPREANQLKIRVDLSTSTFIFNIKQSHCGLSMLNLIRANNNAGLRVTSGTLPRNFQFKISIKEKLSLST